jgi:membrane protein implicated in regulation of membrane protease activity
VPAWLIWIIVAAVLFGAETMSLDLVLLMLGGGALGGAAAAGLGAPPAVQVLVAIVVAVALLGAARPAIRQHMLSGRTIASNADALVGQSAIVLQRVDRHDGRVRLNGAEWSARSFDASQVIEAGKTVQVMEISGATALVWDGP